MTMLVPVPQIHHAVPLTVVIDVTGPDGLADAPNSTPEGTDRSSRKGEGDREILQN